MSWSEAILAKSPNAYWRLGEKSGTSCADSSGKGNVGSYVNAPTLGAAGAIISDSDTAAIFNPTALKQHVLVPDSATLDLGNTFTAIAFIKRSGTGGTDCILDKGPNAYIMRFDGEDHLLLRRNGVGNVAKSTVKVSDSNWHFVVVAWNGTTCRIEIDGMNVTGAVTSQTFANNTTALTIGGSEAGKQDFFRGTLDEIAVFPSFLSEAVTQELFDWFGWEDLPLAETKPATDVVEDGAKLHGTIHPRVGAEDWKNWHFVYGTDNEAVEALEEPPAIFGPEGDTEEPGAVNVEGTLEGLERSTTYYFVLVVEDSLGQEVGEVQSFTTPPIPTAVTGEADVDGLAVTLHGTANAESPFAVDFFFDFGETEAYGSQTPTRYATEGSEPEPISASLLGLGLKPNTIYHYRLVVESYTGLRVYGADETFETGEGIDPSRVPVGDWRPYADDSPWNTQIEKGVPVPDSEAMVEKITPRLSTAAAFSTERGEEDFHHAVYFGEAEDGEHPIELTEDYEADKTMSGAEPHAPKGARPAGGEDGHLAVIDETNGLEYGFWQLTDAVGDENSPLVASWGAPMPIDGSGVTDKVGATAAGFGVAAGLIRGEHLEAGEIPHALFIVADFVEGFVAPATHTGREPEAPEGWPAMGQRLWLNLDPAAIETLGVPQWQEVILRALAKYGAYVGDTGGGLFKTMSPEVYAAAGMADPLMIYAEAHEEDDGITVFEGSAFYEMNAVMLDLLAGSHFSFIETVSDPGVGLYVRVEGELIAL